MSRATTEIEDIVARMEWRDGGGYDVFLVGDWPEVSEISLEMVTLADRESVRITDDNAEVHFTFANGSARYAIEEHDELRGTLIISRIHEQEVAHV